MRKETLVVIISSLIALIFLTVGVCIGEAQTNQQEAMKIKRANEALDKIEQITGYQNLGVLDWYKISEKTGYQYNGPAILTTLFRQNDLELPISYRISTINCDFNKSGISLYRIDERDGRKIIRSYAYGLY